MFIVLKSYRGIHTKLFPLCDFLNVFNKVTYREFNSNARNIIKSIYLKRNVIAKLLSDGFLKVHSLGFK